MKTSVTIAGLTVLSGEKKSAYVTVPGTDYSFPITVINGAEDGKTILASAGIHGCEYPGIKAVAELASEISPEKVSGCILFIHAVNMSGYLLRQPYVVPADEDRKNLNRMFPTDNSGTLADKICVFLMEEFVKRCDFHVDLHSGDSVEALEACTIVANIADPQKKALITEVAKHTRFRWRMNSGGRREFYNGTAITYGIPSILFERGGAGCWSQNEVDDDKADLISVMQCLNILPGEAKLNEEQKFFDKHEWTEAEAGDEGMLIPFVKVGDDIKEGQKLFEIQDMFGNHIRDIYAKYDGHVVIISRTLAVHQNDDLITYGHIAE